MNTEAETSEKTLHHSCAANQIGIWTNMPQLHVLPGSRRWYHYYFCLTGLETCEGDKTKVQKYEMNSLSSYLFTLWNWSLIYFSVNATLTKVQNCSQKFQMSPRCWVWPDKWLLQLSSGKFIYGIIILWKRLRIKTEGHAASAFQVAIFPSKDLAPAECCLQILRQFEQCSPVSSKKHGNTLHSLSTLNSKLFSNTCSYWLIISHSVNVILVIGR